MSTSSSCSTSRGRRRNAVRQHWAPIINSLEEQELFHKFYAQADGESVVEFVTFEQKNPNSILSCLGRARENARSVREQISSEMWEQINRLHLFIRSDEAREMFRGSAYQFYKRVLEGTYQFVGITDATMTHGEGWDFCQLGKYMERADRTSRILDVKYHILLPSGERVGGNVDTIQWMAVLRSCSALEAYCKIYFGHVAPWKVAEFLILHDGFPRALRFCVHQVNRALHRISGSPDEPVLQRGGTTGGPVAERRGLQPHQRDFPARVAPVPGPDATPFVAHQRRRAGTLRSE